MPTISVNKKYLYELINREFSFDELEKIAFDFGLEIEEDGNND